MSIENSFGRLKGRWRILRTACEANIKRLPDYVLSCCVLHNLCERNNELYLNFWDNNDENEEEPLEQPESPDYIWDPTDVPDKRQFICQFLNL